MSFIKGLIEITGPHDSGKSSEACSYYDGLPSDIDFIDADLKGESTAQQMKNDGFPFGFYRDLRHDIRKGDWEKHYHLIEDLVDELESLSHKIVIFDTWNSVYTACKAEVVGKPGIYNKLYGGKWSNDYVIRNGEISREAKRLESSFINRILKFADTLIITSHLKNHYLKNPATGKGEATGKRIPRSSSTIAEIARLRLWLTRSPDTRIPVALVLKNIDKKVWIEGVGLRTKAVLPFKVTPNTKLPEESSDFVPNDLCVWDTIKRYWQHPVGQREFLPEEVPNEEEQSIIDGTLTREQKIMWLSSIQAEKQRVELEKQLLAEENEEKAIELKEAGKSASEIASILGIELKQVLEWTFSVG